jgi:hypothetical protein
MIYHDTETRSLLARERAERLAAEMRVAHRLADVKPSASDRRRFRALLACLRRLARSERYEGPAYEA